MKQQIKRILVIRCGALGDLVVATSVIQALRRAYGKSVIIDWVATPAGKALFKNDKRLRRVFTLKHRKVPIRLSRAKRAIIRHSKKEPYDLLLNLNAGKRFRKLADAIHADVRYGYGFSEPDTFFSSTFALNRMKQHYAPAIGDRTAVADAMPKLYGSGPKKLFKKFALPKRYLVLNPSNSHHRRHKINYRAWPKTHWKALIKMLPERLPLVIIGNRDEDAYFDDMRPFPGHVIDLVGKTSVSELIGIIKLAEAIVTTDTGPSHIASAVHTPVYVLIGPTDINETGPYSGPENSVTVLSSALPCSPCYRTEVMHACRENLCMREIAPEKVVDALSNLFPEKKCFRNNKKRLP